MTKKYLTQTSVMTILLKDPSSMIMASGDWWSVMKMDDLSFSILEHTGTL